jgi:hypothetical protein
MRCRFEGEMMLDAAEYAHINRRQAAGSTAGAISERDALKIAVQAVRLYAESHPRPPHVTQAQAAQMLGLSAQTVNKMVHFGTLKLNACGRIPIEQVDRVIGETS